ncbi:CHAP domain-containing protein [Erythrobacter sp. QSSC1-22B]|uniref:CHAP domain-containing protein n=1 Tax=Erythrobacter sp. QSSC1-22B TaxID=1860125 RepID=UPI000AF2F67F
MRLTVGHFVIGGRIKEVKKILSFTLTGFVILAAPHAFGQSLPALSVRAPSPSTELRPYFRSEPFARKVSGILLYGDAHTWWEQAKSRYATGKVPRIGAVMTFRPHRSLRLGHVATVSRVLDNRSVLLDHANWSPIDGRRGQIERNAIAVDVSPANDWSAVRVWYQPLGSLGKAAWPVEGFIFSNRVGTPSQ